MPDPQLDAIVAAQQPDRWLVDEEASSKPELLPEGGVNQTWHLHIS